MGKGTSERSARDAVWVVLVWGRVAVGLVLVATGGVAFGHAWTREYVSLWWVGAITLLVGILLVVSGLCARSRPADITPQAAMPGEAPPPQEPLVPLLGALLVYKYQRITHKQLNEALAQQRKEQKNRRRLGEILLEMGAITEPQLEEALAQQRLVLDERAPGQES